MMNVFFRVFSFKKTMAIYNIYSVWQLNAQLLLTAVTLLQVLGRLGTAQPKPLPHLIP